MGVILGDPWTHTQPSLVCGGGVVVAAWANKQLATVASVWSWSSARPSVPRIVTGRLLTPRGKNLPYPEDACDFITVKTAERNPELCLHKPQHVKITHFRNIMKRIYGLLKMFVKTPFSSHTLKLLSSPMMCISKTPLPASAEHHSSTKKAPPNLAWQWQNSFLLVEVNMQSGESLNPLE